VLASRRVLRINGEGQCTPDFIIFTCSDMLGGHTGLISASTKIVWLSYADLGMTVNSVANENGGGRDDRAARIAN
jgi:hypothetical protein